VMVRTGVGIEDDIVLASAAYDAQHARIDQAVQRVVDRGQSDGLSLLANLFAVTCLFCPSAKRMCAMASRGRVALRPSVSRKEAALKSVMRAN
jgi:hypothetical protein